MMNYDLSADDIPADTGGSTMQEMPAGDLGVSDAGQPAPEPDMHEYQANGKTIREDLQTILKRASQGYNYAQSMHDHKQAVEQFSQERKSHLDQYGEWKQMHEYASQNPEWAEFVRGQWEQKEAFGQQQPVEQAESMNQPQVSPEIKAFMDEYRQDKRLRMEEAEDAALNEQIQSVQKEFPDFDLSHTDPETGASLEMQVLEHARANGINSFKAAFKDLLFDQIVNKKITASKEAAAKEISSRLNSGHVTESNLSLSNLSAPKRNSTNSSYHDLVMEGGQELGIL